MSMDDDFIKREDAMNTMCDCCHSQSYCTYEKDRCCKYMDKFLTIKSADVRHVVHAEWDADGKCTACGKRWNEYMHDSGDDWGYFDPMPPFCLNCGADMRGYMQT